MSQDILNQIIAEIEALNTEIKELREEVKKLRQNQPLDISEIDPMELLDAIDEAANSRS